MRSPFAHIRHGLPALALLVAGAAWSAPYVCPDGERFGRRPAPNGFVCGLTPLTDQPQHSDAAPLHAGDMSQRPTCPRSGFVMFRDVFKPAEARRLRAFMQTDEYRALRDDESPHYLRARAMQVIGEPDRSVFWALADAARDSSAPQHARRWRHYAEELVAAADALPSEPGRSDLEQVAIQYLALAWERRLGRFDAARARLGRVTPPPELPIYATMLGHQAAWIARRDSDPHWVRPEQVQIRLVPGTARNDGITLPRAAL